MSDPYLPHRGDSRIRVRRYDLELDYRPQTNALTGRARLLVEAAVDLTALELDLVGLGVDRVRVAGRAAKHRHRGGRLSIALALPAGARTEVDVRYSGEPGPVIGPWGEVGWEELTDGSLVASQPDGAPTWFPCNDTPADKAAYGISVTTDSAYTVAATGALVRRKAGGSRTSWTFEQPAPTPTYLASVQIGRYERHLLGDGPVVQELLCPPRLRARALRGTARQPRMLEVFTGLFGPYPFDGYTLVVTDDDLEIPVEAQAMSVFGANHVDGGSERLVAHELAHQWFGNSLTVARWQDIWLHEGFACYAEWLWSQASGGPAADTLARQAHARLVRLPQDLRLSDPGPALMFDDRLYKRGALTLHALRCSAGDPAFFDLLRAWTAAHRHGSVSTDGFVRLADERLGAGDLLSAWLDALPLPAAPGRRAAPPRSAAT